VQQRGRGGGEGVRTRDHLANVRTTLAWIRTGLVLMGVGYATDKLAALAVLHGAVGGLLPYGRPLGLAAIGAGVLLAAAALPRFLGARARIESARFEPRPGTDLALIVALAAGALVLLLLLAVTR
jgi:uncharacterized membrane protein YidH (DUF202 family)